jgi:hypothetical protein
VTKSGECRQRRAERHYPVRLRGVITFFDQRTLTKAYRFIQDETVGIYFYMDPGIADQSFKPGQFVEMEGETGQGEFAPVMVAHHIEILGEGKFPEAKPVSFEELASGQNKFRQLPQALAARITSISAAFIAIRP